MEIYSNIIIEKKNNIGKIILNRPKKLNALNVTMCQELLLGIKNFDRDADVRCILLSGSGKAFCSGGDLAEIINFTIDNPNESIAKIVDEIVSSINPVILAIKRSSKPVIGVINGICSGAGVGLAQACDILIAGESAELQMSYSKIGQVPDGGNCYFLVKSIGYKKAAEIVFCGGSVNAQEGVKIGLFNKVVPDLELELESQNIAKRIIKNSFLSLKIAKEQLIKATYENLETILKIEKEGVIKCAETKEFKNGIKFFIEKKKIIK